MQIPNGAIVAVADGEKLNLFRNTGNEKELKLTALTEADVNPENPSSGSRHHSSSANPDDGQTKEDGFAAGVADLLNGQVLSGQIKALVVIAAPRTLGELRKHYHKNLEAALIGEIAKDLTGHSVDDVEAAISTLK